MIHGYPSTINEMWWEMARRRQCKHHFALGVNCSRPVPGILMIMLRSTNSTKQLIVYKKSILNSESDLHIHLYADPRKVCTKVGLHFHL